VTIPCLRESILNRFRGREIVTTGDGFVAVFDGPARAVRCAQAISSSVDNLGIAIRAGIHTGEVELVGSDIRGLAVHEAARVAGAASRRPGYGAIVQPA
jgi:class 3 adenylate cyclase